MTSRVLALPKPQRRAIKAKSARKTRPRARRKSSLACLKRKLWAAFSAYVKERDGNVCFSCGRGGLEGSGWHAGHLFPAGAHNVIRYEPKNVHSQCFHCNCNLGGNGAAYTVQFINRYGIDELQRLAYLSRQLKPWKAYEIEELIEALSRGGADYECFYAERYGVRAA